jgi:hypothetical protein
MTVRRESGRGQSSMERSRRTTRGRGLTDATRGDEPAIGLRAGAPLADALVADAPTEGGSASAPSTHDGPLDALLAETPEITPLGRRTSLGVMLFLDQAPTMAVAVLDAVDAGRHADALPVVGSLCRVAEELGLLRLAGVCMGLQGALERRDAAGASRWAARLHDSVARARHLLRDLGASDE